MTVKEKLVSYLEYKIRDIASTVKQENKSVDYYRDGLTEMAEAILQRAEDGLFDDDTWLEVENEKD